MSDFTPFHRGGSGSPLVLIHGFTDTWRTWDLVRPVLERRHDVFAPTMAGHTGGPVIDGEIDDATMADSVERAMDEAGIETAHVAGNSLGGFTALQLAARGRARSVVALAPAGGWAVGDPELDRTMDFFRDMQGLIVAAAPYADAAAETPEGRAQATQFLTEHPEVLPAELVSHIIRGAAGCERALDLAEAGRTLSWDLDAEKIECPVRIVWGTADRILGWPSSAHRFRREWLPHADWVELDDVGHCPQLDVPLETAELILGFTG